MRRRRRAMMRMRMGVMREVDGEDEDVDYDGRRTVGVREEGAHVEGQPSIPTEVCGGSQKQQCICDA
eukprot:1161891-Pelagomonas_calceolata.AAC.6